MSWPTPTSSSTDSWACPSPRRREATARCRRRRRRHGRRRAPGDGRRRRRGVTGHRRARTAGRPRSRSAWSTCTSRARPATRRGASSSRARARTCSSGRRPPPCTCCAWPPPADTHRARLARPASRGAGLGSSSCPATSASSWPSRSSPREAERLAAWAAEALEAWGGLRLVPAANLHVTLVFCGAWREEPSGPRSRPTREADGRACRPAPLHPDAGARCSGPRWSRVVHRSRGEARPSGGPAGPCVCAPPLTGAGPGPARGPPLAAPRDRRPRPRAASAPRLGPDRAAVRRPQSVRGGCLHYVADAGGVRLPPLAFIGLTRTRGRMSRPIEEADVADEREQALQAALGQIERQFGKGSIMRMGERVAPARGGDLHRLARARLGARHRRPPARPRRRDLRPRVLGQDDALLPRHRRGPEARRVARLHRRRARASTPGTPRRIGVDIDELLVSQPDNGEQALEIAEMLVRSGALDVVVHRLGGRPGAQGRDRGRDGRLASSACRRG